MTVPYHENNAICEAIDEMAARSEKRLRAFLKQMMRNETEKDVNPVVLSVAFEVALLKIGAEWTIIMKDLTGSKATQEHFADTASQIWKIACDEQQSGEPWRSACTCDDKVFRDTWDCQENCRGEIA